jgi:hypothetical protein
VKQQLASGRNVLRGINNEHPSRLPNPDDPFVTSLLRCPPTEPIIYSRFFLATDERSPEALQHLRSNGAILINDLLRPDDRWIVGWPLLLTDVLSIMEQAVMSKAAYFHATAVSSVAGGVMNMRAAEGKDARTSILE